MNNAKDMQNSLKKVSLSKKVAWGAGGLADNYMLGVPNQLAMPIYNIGYGVSAVLIGFALAAPRLLDVFFDILVGNWSDNTRSKWGRRKPWMVAGVSICVFLLPLLWIPPFSSEQGRFIYFLILSSLYFLGYSLFVVPYTAMGYELTTDYEENTKILAWRMYIGLIGSFTVPWVYKLCFLPIFGKNDLEGVKWVAVIVSGIIISVGLLPVIFCKENEKTFHQDKIPLKKALIQAFKNKAFRMISVGYILILWGLVSSMTISIYVYIHVVCRENKELASEIVGWCGSATALTSYLSLPLAGWFSVKFGKKEAMVLSLLIALLGISLYIFVLNPHVPFWSIHCFGRLFQIPYLQMIPAMVFGMGMQGAWLLISAMISDVCDEEEWISGVRQEGIFSAVNSFSQKVAMGGAALTGGLLLKWAGYTTGVSPTESIGQNLKWLYIGGQGLGIILAIVLFCFYPISRARALETRRILDERYHKNNQF